MQIFLVSTGTPSYDSYPNPNHGTAIQIWGLAREFSELGHNVTIVSGTYDERESYETEGITIRKVPTPSIDSALNGVFSKLLFSKRVAGMIEDEKPDIVFLRERVTALFPARLEIPSVYTVISPDSFDFFYHFTVKKHSANRLLFRYKRYLESQVLENAGVSIVINQWMESYLRNRGYHDTYYIPMGIPAEDFETVEEKPWDESILFAGRLEPVKRPDWAVDSFEKAVDDGYTLTIVGDGSLKSRLFSRVDERGLSHLVDFTGHVEREKLLRLMHRSSILVHPAEFEMGGNVILEGLASGCAVVSSDTMGASSMIDRESNGLLFNKYNQAELIQELSRLSRNQDLQRRLGKQAQNDVKQSHTMGRIAERYLDVADQVVE